MITVLSRIARSRRARTGREEAAWQTQRADPDKYKVIFENERVRVLEYRDEPGEATRPHEHPDSLMYTLSSFDRRLVAESDESRDVSLDATMSWPRLLLSGRGRLSWPPTLAQRRYPATGCRR